MLTGELSTRWKLLGRSRRRLGGNIITDLKEIGVSTRN